MVLVVRNLLANAGDARDAGSIPGSGKSLGGGNGNRSSILAGISPWTEEPGRLQFMGLQRVKTTLSMHACIIYFDINQCKGF